jgi:hypothetical protein
MKKLHIIFVLALMLTSCNYLDIVPDNIATIDNAFNMRNTAERFLYTCYSYMPASGNFSSNPAFTIGDEFWIPERNSTPAWNIARGNQRVNDPYMNFWQGRQGGKDLYEGIRQCNVFLENIGRVPDMDDAEKERWKGEVLFLKAYYHFYLLRMFGPIPLIKENVPVDASYGDVYPTRNTVDDCFNYILELIDEATPLLPEQVYSLEEYGRISKAVAYAEKAVILTEAASPLFNGNTDYVGFKNNRGEELFNGTKSVEKWQKAADACLEAITFCTTKNPVSGKPAYELYTYNEMGNLAVTGDTMQTQMNIRGSLTEAWNSEVIWGNTQSWAVGIQNIATPRGLNPEFISNTTTEGWAAPTLKMAELYYSENGVPIEDDEQYNYSGRYDVSLGNASSRLYIKEGYITSNLHFNREPRFYASMGFDGGIWYGQGKTNYKNPDELLYISAKKGQPAAAQNAMRYSVTGYWAKKLVSFRNAITKDNYNPIPYAWPEIRLADLYLLYAETLNEANGGPTEDAFKYIDMVRARAGLKGVKESWSVYSRRKDHETYVGFQRIVHRERLIELAFEGKRFWDLCRWKEATVVLNYPISGWDVSQEDALAYYNPKIIFNQRFTTRDYFWPIPEAELLSNKNLNQFPGW